MRAETIRPLPSSPMATWRSALSKRKIASGGSGSPSAELRVNVSGRWFALWEPAPAGAATDLLPMLDATGFWKPVSNGTSAFRTFEIPAWTIADQADADSAEFDEAVTHDQMLDWVLASRVGRVPDGWKPPARDLVESWLPKGALTIQADGQVRQGELTLRPDRWALRVPLLPRLPQDLPEPRMRALRALIWEAQSHWALVRFGKDNDGDQGTLSAAVDFTGAPHSELLFSAGLDVLRHVVRALVETVDVLAATSVVLESLSLDRTQTNQTERSTT